VVVWFSSLRLLSWKWNGWLQIAVLKNTVARGGELSNSTSPNFELSDDSMIDMIQIMDYCVTPSGTIRDGRSLKKSKEEKRLEFILHVVFFGSLRD
jgi:hypothetical protein